MNINKNKILTRIGSVLLLTSFIIIPSISLTSCASSWQVGTPVSVGTSMKGLSGDPYKTIRKGSGSETYDSNGSDLAEYLPSSYIYDENQNKIYSYCSPVSAVDTSGDPAEWYNPAWYSLQSQSSANEKNYYPTSLINGDDSFSVVENYNLIYSNSMINNIAVQLSSYIKIALKYATTDLDEESLDLSFLGTHKDESNTEFSHGSQYDTDKTTNNNFYEFFFALANTASLGKNSTYFTDVAIKYEFINNVPFVTFDSSGNLNEYWENIFGLTIPNTGKEPQFGESNFITSYVENDFNGDGVIESKVATYTNIPFYIKPTTMTFTYTNQTSHDSFHPEQYYVNDIQTVQNNVGTSWSEMDKYTGNGDSKPENLQFELDFTGNLEQIPSYGFITSTLELNSFFIPMTFTVTNSYDESGQYTNTTYTNISMASNLYTIYPSYFLLSEDSYIANEFKDDSNNNIKASSGAMIIDLTNVAAKSETMFDAWIGVNRKQPSSLIGTEDEYILDFLYYLLANQDASGNIDINTANIIKVIK